MLLARRARELERHLPQAVGGDVNGVHQARVASRRLREALPVLSARSKRERKAERKVRRVTQALGSVREMDVTVGVLDELARSPAIPRDALEEVRGYVLAERERRRIAMLAELREVNTAKLVRRLHELALDGAVAQASPEWKERLSRRIASRAGRLRTAVAAAGQMYAPDRLHAVRLATKKLRYALELAAETRVPGAGPLVAQLKRTQETLGRLNDLHVILGHVAAVDTRPSGRRATAVRGLDTIAATLEEECRHLHARYIKRVPALSDLAEECRMLMERQPTGAGRSPRLHAVSERHGTLAVRRA